MAVERWIRPGFLLIGGTTVLGPPAVSRGWTNDVLFAVHPAVITPFAFVLLVLWGCAYLATASRPRAHRRLVAVFAAEKLAFALTWVLWWRGDVGRVRAVFERDLFAGLFFASYGLLDLLCAAFFAWVAWGREPAGAPGPLPSRAPDRYPAP